MKIALFAILCSLLVGSCKGNDFWEKMKHRCGGGFFGRRTCETRRLAGQDFRIAYSSKCSDAQDEFAVLREQRDALLANKFALVTQTHQAVTESARLQVRQITVVYVLFQSSMLAKFIGRQLQTAGRTERPQDQAGGHGEGEGKVTRRGESLSW